jgi:hypothetical protein
MWLAVLVLRLRLLWLRLRLSVLNGLLRLLLLGNENIIEARE